MVPEPVYPRITQRGSAATESDYSFRKLSKILSRMLGKISIVFK